MGMKITICATQEHDKKTHILCSILLSESVSRFDNFLLIHVPSHFNSQAFLLGANYSFLSQILESESCQAINECEQLGQEGRS